MTRDVDRACPFCRIALQFDSAPIVRAWRDALAITPDNPVSPAGHVLIVSLWHVQDAAEDPAATAGLAWRAAELIGEAGGDWNLIYSVGPSATQTAPHLRMDAIRRTHGDGIALPWSPTGV